MFWSSCRDGSVGTNLVAEESPTSAKSAKTRKQRHKEKSDYTHTTINLQWISHFFVQLLCIPISKFAVLFMINLYFFSEFSQAQKRRYFVILNKIMQIYLYLIIVSCIYFSIYYFWSTQCIFFFHYHAGIQQFSLIQFFYIAIVTSAC